MEYHVFSHNDEQYRITAEPGEYLRLYDPLRDHPSFFIPPSENRYDQILRIKFGLGQDSFEQLRRDQFPSWKITEVIFYGPALSIRHTTVFDKPIAKAEGIRLYHGVRAEQSFIETIPYENISAGNFSLKLKLLNAKDEARAKWSASIGKDKITITTPGNMQYEITRTRL